MSEQDEQRPLSRRERRLREMAETGALDLSEISEMVAEPKPVSQPKIDNEIEISPFHEDGTPRSRREMRELRERALAERAQAAPEAADGADVEASDPAESTTDAASETSEIDDVAAEDAPAEAAQAERASVEEVPVEPAGESIPEPVPAVRPAPNQPWSSAPEADAAVASADDAPEAVGVDGDTSEADTAEQLGHDPAPGDQTGAIDFDTLIAPPTEPFTVAELQEAEAAAADDLDEEDEPAGASADEPAPVEAAPAEKPKRRFPWQRKTTADDVADASPSDEASAEGAAEQTQAGDAESDSVTTTDEVPEAATEAVAVEDVVVVEETVAIAEVAEPEAEPTPEEASPEQKASYSFPDIAPPEEWRSVFDDPTSRKVPDQGGQGGDFDDLISRAVAQEGTSTTAGTSALILPSMPEDTGGLTGPIGATGELYVTGSLQLPKSLGETGGHSALHDSIEIDPITGEESADLHMTGEGPAPVSARHAVSARAASGLPMAKPVTDRSKLPLVLSLTGGGLLVVIVALGVWGASNGMFG